MEKFQKPIHTSSVKSDVTDHKKSPKRASQDEIRDINVEIRHLFPGSDVSLCYPKLTTARNNCISRTE
ncbi:hypothetical protein AYI70_g3186 [Smittium culicis]|uniref:Uncharacterized protein n=1 Tax=Smittium culicis TaxID=133412 RepID=A0A1R1XLU7_9FUNG|nr:hypothetical protein AYI70_g7168 [Smittium culicis]OMJ21912.1 hypothetical protein AYI70_g3186 [Smittium culicis]